MASRDGCVDGVAGRNGRDKKEVEIDLQQLERRANMYEEDGEAWEDALRRAGNELAAEAHARARAAQREAILNERANYRRRSDYQRGLRELEALATSPNANKLDKMLLSKVRIQAPRLVVESAQVGVNTPFYKSTGSAAALQGAEKARILGGFVRDLETNKAGPLQKIFASRSLEKQWTDELFQLWKGDKGTPGVSGSKEALELAKTIFQYQKLQLDRLNSVGAWVRSYQGYIARTTHDSMKIYNAGRDQWVSDIMNNPGFDRGRTFGTRDAAKVKDVLDLMYQDFAKGDHTDWGSLITEPKFPSLAKKLAAARELHWKDAEGWRSYNEKYGTANPTQTIIDTLAHNAERTALMRKFGTQPGKAMESDFAYMKDMLGNFAREAVTKAGKLEASGGDASEIAKLRDQEKLYIDQAKDFENSELMLRNRFAQIDGTSKKPIKSLGANIVSGWMAVNRMGMLHFVALTHFASLPTKMAAQNYWGIPFGKRLADTFNGLTRGLQGTAKREVGDLMLVHQEQWLNQQMSNFDVADAPKGMLAKLENISWKLNPVGRLMANQRSALETSFAWKLGTLRDKAWADIGREEKRVLNGFGVGEQEWKLFHNVEWTKAGDKTYFVPSDIEKLSDEQMRAYMASIPRQAGTTITDSQVERARTEMALTMAAAYHNYSEAGMVMPDPRTRAILFGKNFEPGSKMNLFLKLALQFKIWPAAMITRNWGREIYGRIGDPAMNRVGGIVELAVAGAIFGTAAEVIRAELKGVNGLAQLTAHPMQSLARGLQRSGVGSLIGDFILGETDRHGYQFALSMMGPTAEAGSDLYDLLHAGGNQTHPWRERGALAIKFAKSHNPIFNTWATNTFLNYLIWYRLQDWINPGYLERMERRMKSQQGTEFWLSPQHPAQALGLAR